MKRTWLLVAFVCAAGPAAAGPDRVLVGGFATVASTGQDFALARHIASTPVTALSFSVE